MINQIRLYFWTFLLLNYLWLISLINNFNWRSKTNIFFFISIRIWINKLIWIIHSRSGTCIYSFHHIINFFWKTFALRKLTQATFYIYLDILRALNSIWSNLLKGSRSRSRWWFRIRSRYRFRLLLKQILFGILFKFSLR